MGHQGLRVSQNKGYVNRPAVLVNFHPEVKELFLLPLMQGFFLFKVFCLFLDTLPVNLL